METAPAPLSLDFVQDETLKFAPDQPATDSALLSSFRFSISSSFFFLLFVVDLFFRIDRGGVEHFISFLRSLPFSFAKSQTRNGRRNRFPAVLSVNSFGFHDGGLLAFTVIATE